MASAWTDVMLVLHHPYPYHGLLRALGDTAANIPAPETVRWAETSHPSPASGFFFPPKKTPRLQAMHSTEYVHTQPTIVGYAAFY